MTCRGFGRHEQLLGKTSGQAQLSHREVLPSGLVSRSRVRRARPACGGPSVGTPTVDRVLISAVRISGPWVGWQRAGWQWVGWARVAGRSAGVAHRGPLAVQCWRCRHRDAARAGERRPVAARVRWDCRAGGRWAARPGRCRRAIRSQLLRRRSVAGSRRPRPSAARSRGAAWLVLRVGPLPWRPAVATCPLWGAAAPRPQAVTLLVAPAVARRGAESRSRRTGRTEPCVRPSGCWTALRIWQRN
jgi:hypothetical protein